MPHLSDIEKAELREHIPPHQRDARIKGIPCLGSGAIYPVPESDIRVKDFEIPKHWPRGFGLDTGWNQTAAVWGALDREGHVLYIYAAYRRGKAEPAVHAEAIRARGSWIPGVGDVAALATGDGRQYLAIYRRLGLKIQSANKAVEAGIQEVWDLLSAGRLKVLHSCVDWFDEFRQYRRDDDGRIVKAHDHLMDAKRYLVRGRRQMRTQRPALRYSEPGSNRRDTTGLGWMG